MHIEKLKSIQECLASAAEAQVYDLENVDAQELGEVIDIIKDIEEKYGYMLSCGATTFWETIDGWHAFSDAGSLCHGWSALPAYYLKTLLK